MIHVFATIQTSTTQIRVEVDQPVEYEVTCKWLEDHTFFTTDPRQLFCKKSHGVSYYQHRIGKPPLMPSASRKVLNIAKA